MLIHCVPKKCDHIFDDKLKQNCPFAKIWFYKNQTVQKITYVQMVVPTETTCSPQPPRPVAQCRQFQEDAKDASVSECTWTLSALEALRNVLYKLMTYLLTYLHNSN